jgi:glycosyltransferase involved in cell wall biosynthesis
MRDRTGRGLILVPAWPGQTSSAELERLAISGARPRTDYVELARALDAEVMDFQYMQERATRVAWGIARHVGIVEAQIAEAFLRRGHYDHVVARADRLGLPLALLFKLARSRRDLVLISGWLSRQKKAIFLRNFKVHSHMSAIVNYSSVQMQIAADRLGVARGKLHHALQPVDERFWRPTGEAVEDMICSVGSEARDYPTLLEAVRGLDVSVELAVGSTVVRSKRAKGAEVAPVPAVVPGDLPQNVRVRRSLSPRELRGLYSRARFAVVPIKDVEFDAGVTAMTEAMAMGKAVVVTRTRGQVDVLRDGEHGCYVPPGDAAALRAAIVHLMDHPGDAERMGRAGRALVEARHRLDGWVSQVAAVVRAGGRAG